MFRARQGGWLGDRASIHNGKPGRELLAGQALKLTGRLLQTATILPRARVRDASQDPERGHYPGKHPIADPARIV